MLVAIAIPIFNTQLEKSREATDVANIRNNYAEIMAALVGGDTINYADYSVTLTQKKDGWQKSDVADSLKNLEESKDETLHVVVNVKDSITAASPVTFTYAAGSGTSAATLTIGQ